MKRMICEMCSLVKFYEMSFLISKILKILQTTEKVSDPDRK